MREKNISHGVVLLKSKGKISKKLSKKVSDAVDKVIRKYKKRLKMKHILLIIFSFFVFGCDPVENCINACSPMSLKGKVSDPNIIRIVEKIHQQRLECTKMCMDRQKNR